MCSKIKRNPVVSRSAAAYLGEFTAGETDAGFTKGDAIICSSHLRLTCL